MRDQVTRRKLLLLGLLLAWPALGDVVCTGSANSCGSSGATGVTNGGTVLTANTVPKATSATVLANSTITDDGTTVTLNTATTAKAAVIDGNTQFLGVTGTLGATSGANSKGINFSITGAGSQAFEERGLIVSLLAGYTGSARNTGGHFINGSAGTAATEVSTGTATNGVFGNVNGSPTVGVGVFGITNSGTMTRAYGVLGDITSGTLGAGIGVAGFSATGTARIGGYFGLDVAVPTYTSAALIADNSSVAAPIFLARDNGTTAYAIQDDASVWASQATKTLTESAATTFVRVAVASGARTGGTLFYCINAADASDHQERCGSVPFAVVNKAGTETCALGTAADVVAVSAGTLTVAFTADTATPTNGCDLQANAVSSLTQTTLNMSYFVQLNGIAASAVTPQ